MAIARNQQVHAPRITRINQARQLAEDHRTNDPDTTNIYFVEDPADREVRLLEVSTSVGNAGAVMPVRFTARPEQGLDYPTVIVLLSPEEKAQVDAGNLELPETWGVNPELQPL
jgi:hypothetical protein